MTSRVSVTVMRWFLTFAQVPPSGAFYYLEPQLIAAIAPNARKQKGLGCVVSSVRNYSHWRDMPATEASTCSG